MKFASILFFSACLSWQSGCRVGPSIHYVLPAGYVGVFQIVEDAGVSPIEENDGRYIYEIPGDGVLHVRSFKPFRELREVTSSYSDGTRLPGMFDEGSTGMTVALRHLGSHKIGNAPETIVMLVGTESQAEYTNNEIYSGTEFFKIPPTRFNERLKEIK